MKFGMGETGVRSIPASSLVEVELDGESTVLGALADSVQEVYEMESSQIEPPPRMGPASSPSSSPGWAKAGTGSSSFWISTRCFRLRN
jgi:purine-binding chemotaxis protein CheW